MTSTVCQSYFKIDASVWVLTLWLNSDDECTVSFFLSWSLNIIYVVHINTSFSISHGENQNKKIMFSEMNHLLIMYTEEKTKNLLLTLKPLKRCDLLNYYELNLLNFVNHAVSMLSKIKKRTRRRALCFASSNSYNRVIYILILTDIIQ